MQLPDRHFKAAVAAAVEAFWAKLAAAYPEATTGDIDPLADIRFDGAAQAAALSWVYNNVTDQEG
jgi:hypothetical protein